MLSRSGQIAYNGYRWNYFSSMTNVALRSRAHDFLKYVDWEGLLANATKQAGGKNCSLRPEIGLGYNHMVRIIEFADGLRWVARLRMPSLAGETRYPDSLEARIDAEISTISLVSRKTAVPVPRIHLHKTQENCDVNAPFMLMDCLDGNVGMDLGMSIPREYTETFLRQLARIHVSYGPVCPGLIRSYEHVRSRLPCSPFGSQR